MKDLADFYEEIGEENKQWNARQRAKIEALYQKYGECWLGNINLHDKQKPIMWQYKGQWVYNFDAAFAVPHFDEELFNLIAERDRTPYAGTKEDMKWIVKISLRIEDLGGFHLLWS